MPEYLQPLPPVSPQPDRTSYGKMGNSTDAAPIAGDIEPLPQWYPDEITKDARLARIAPENVNGEYTRAHDSSNPVVLESVSHAAHAESEALLGAAPLVTPRRRPPY
jgi:hypothetical protein